MESRTWNGSTTAPTAFGPAAAGLALVQRFVVIANQGTGKNPTREKTEWQPYRANQRGNDFRIGRGSFNQPSRRSKMRRDEVRVLHVGETL